MKKRIVSILLIGVLLVMAAFAFADEKKETEFKTQSYSEFARPIVKMLEEQGEKKCSMIFLTKDSANVHCPSWYYSKEVQIKHLGKVEIIYSDQTFFHNRLGKYVPEETEIVIINIYHGYDIHQRWFHNIGRNRSDPYCVDFGYGFCQDYDLGDYIKLLSEIGDILQKSAKKSGAKKTVPKK